MEQNEGASGFRARLTQLLAWVTGVREQERQQQLMEADRQTRDGIVRGNDDPDNRRQQGTGQPNQGDLGRWAERHRRFLVQDTEGPVSMERIAKQSPLLDPAELATMRERLQAHHRALQEQRQQQQRGRGWGG